MLKLIEVALRDNTTLTLTPAQLRMINLKATEHWYDHYVEEDSPKGETVPGVNFEHTLRYAA